MDAKFEKAFEKTMGHEGGYANDPDDAGGETYRGVARRYHPSWPGWEIIDALREEHDSLDALKEALRDHSVLQIEVEAFYKEQFWDRFWGDEVPAQSVADELFDTAVNMGVGRAVKFLQMALNVLNRYERNYSDIVEDGEFGPGTLRALEDYLELDEPDMLLKVMNVLQGMHYIKYMRKSPKQEKYARGWFKRVEFIKS